MHNDEELWNVIEETIFDLSDGIEELEEELSNMRKRAKRLERLLVEKRRQKKERT